MSLSREEAERRIVLHQLLRRRGLESSEEEVLHLDEVAGYLTGSLFEAEELRIESAALANGLDRRRIRRLRRVFEGRVAPAVRTRAGTRRRMDSPLTLFFRRYGALILALLVFAAAIIISVFYSDWFRGKPLQSPRRGLVVSKVGSPVFEDSYVDRTRPAYPGAWIPRGTTMKLERGDRVTLLFEDGTFGRIDATGSRELASANEAKMARLFRAADNFRRIGDSPVAKDRPDRETIFIKAPRGDIYERRPTIYWVVPNRIQEFRVVLTSQKGGKVFEERVRSDRATFPTSALDLEPEMGYRVQLYGVEEDAIIAESEIFAISRAKREAIDKTLSDIAKAPGSSLLKALLFIDQDLISEAAVELARLRERDADNVSVLKLLELCYRRLDLRELADRTAELAIKRAD